MVLAHQIFHGQQVGRRAQKKYISGMNRLLVIKFGNSQAAGLEAFIFPLFLTHLLQILSCHDIGSGKR